MEDWRKLPVLRTDHLLFEDTESKPAPGAIVPCLMCTKPFIMRVYVGEVDQICNDCWKTYQDAARVVCWKCKVTICRVVPKVLDNGFYIRPRMILHSSACNVCEPGLKTSHIIEIEEWQKRMRPGRIIVPFSGTKKV